MRKKGWIDDDSTHIGADAKEGRVGVGWGKWWGRGESGVRIVVEIATAWAVTKALLPLRLTLSVWGTPWFARLTILPVMKRFKSLFGGVAGKSVLSPAAGTNAVGAGAVPRSVGKV